MMGSLKRLRQLLVTATLWILCWPMYCADNQVCYEFDQFWYKMFRVLLSHCDDFGNLNLLVLFQTFIDCCRNN
jgi:hypothetical protein